MKERIYLSGFEIYREYDTTGSTMSLERETLHVMDDRQRIALVETRTQGDDGSPAQLIRYQFGNHLGSASLELDKKGDVISYEEYYPYGSTSYQAVDKSIKAAAKRYRYTGMERDEETGLAYHGARYYAGWLGRWCSADPAGFVDGLNRFTFVRDNPVRFIDPDGLTSEEGVDIDQDDDEPSNSPSKSSTPSGIAEFDSEERPNVFIDLSSRSSEGLDPELRGYDVEYIPPYQTRVNENITIIGSANFQAKTIRDLEKLMQYDVGKLVLEDLLASGAKVSLLEAASFYPNELLHLDWWASGGPILSKEHRALFNAETREVGAEAFNVWYPQYDDVTLDRVTTPSFVVLGHELFHVRQHLRPISEREFLFKKNPVSGIRNIETEAVEFENRLRRTAELPLRRYYGGMPLKGGESIWPWELFSPDPNPPDNADSEQIYDPYRNQPLQ